VGACVLEYSVNPLTDLHRHDITEILLKEALNPMQKKKKNDTQSDHAVHMKTHVLSNKLFHL
jgi:hypothetical protein